jgi:ribosome biogenesis GTPase
MHRVLPLKEPMKPLPTLQQLGLDDGFEQQARHRQLQSHQLARVVAVDRDQYLLLNESGSFRAKLSGRLRHESLASEQLPCVGDWLQIEKGADDDFAMVHDVLARKTFLRRKAVGQSSDYQMIAANIDTVFIAQSCHFDFNLKRLERYLLMVADGQADPVILLTKTDLVSDDELGQMIDLIRQADIRAPIRTLSNVTQQGIDELNQLLLPGQTYCFVGSSGVGKSTIINGLTGHATLATNAVSASGEGTHTTVRRELIRCDNGAMVIDTPGMRELGMLASDQTLDSGFADIDRLAKECRFRDCTHNGEPDCAVQRALRDGDILPEHLDNFKKLGVESRYNRMTRAEKRQKDRDFGRFIKNAKKDWRRD